MSVKAEVTFEASRVLAMLSGFGDKTRWLRALKSVVAVFLFKDVIDHFRKEEGPDGKWPDLNKSYAKWKQGKGKTKKLILTGNLRQNFLPTNVRSHNVNSVAFFNPVNYGGQHDRGEGVPQRQFMWISNRAQDLMDRALVDTMVGGRDF